MNNKNKKTINNRTYKNKTKKHRKIVGGDDTADLLQLEEELNTLIRKYNEKVEYTKKLKTDFNILNEQRNKKAREFNKNKKNLTSTEFDNKVNYINSLTLNLDNKKKELNNKLIPLDEEIKKMIKIINDKGSEIKETRKKIAANRQKNHKPQLIKSLPTPTVDIPLNKTDLNKNDYTKIVLPPSPPSKLPPVEIPKISPNKYNPRINPPSKITTADFTDNIPNLIKLLEHFTNHVIPFTQIYIDRNRNYFDNKIINNEISGDTTNENFSARYLSGLNKEYFNILTLAISVLNEKQKKILNDFLIEDGEKTHNRINNVFKLFFYEDIMKNNQDIQKNKLYNIFSIIFKTLLISLYKITYPDFIIPYGIYHDTGEQIKAIEFFEISTGTLDFVKTNFYYIKKHVLRLEYIMKINSKYNSNTKKQPFADGYQNQQPMANIRKPTTNTNTFIKPPPPLDIIDTAFVTASKKSSITPYFNMFNSNKTNENKERTELLMPENNEYHLGGLGGLNLNPKIPNTDITILNTELYSIYTFDEKYGINIFETNTSSVLPSINIPFLINYLTLYHHNNLKNLNKHNDNTQRILHKFSFLTLNQIYNIILQKMNSLVFYFEYKKNIIKDQITTIFKLYRDIHHSKNTRGSSKEIQYNFNFIDDYITNYSNENKNKSFTNSIFQNIPETLPSQMNDDTVYKNIVLSIIYTIKTIIIYIYKTYPITDYYLNNNTKSEFDYAEMKKIMKTQNATPNTSFKVNYNDIKAENIPLIESFYPQKSKFNKINDGFTSLLTTQIFNKTDNEDATKKHINDIELIKTIKTNIKLIKHYILSIENILNIFNVVSDDIFLKIYVIPEEKENLAKIHIAPIKEPQWGFNYENYYTYTICTYIFNENAKEWNYCPLYLSSEYNDIVREKNNTGNNTKYKKEKEINSNFLIGYTLLMEYLDKIDHTPPLEYIKEYTDANITINDENINNIIFGGGDDTDTDTDDVATDNATDP